MRAKEKSAKYAQGDEREDRSFEGNVFPRFKIPNKYISE